MNTYIFWMRESTLTVPTGATDDLHSIGSARRDNEWYAHCYAETTDNGHWVERELAEIARRATSGEMVVTKEVRGAPALSEGALRFIVTPGEVRVERATITWEQAGVISEDFRPEVGSDADELSDWWGDTIWGKIRWKIFEARCWLAGFDPEDILGG